MPAYIIHREGAYNAFSTITDNVYFDQAMSLERLREWHVEEYGTAPIEQRLARAHATGCSGLNWTLRDVIDANKAAPGEKRMPEGEFIERFLTLPAAD